MKMNKALTMAFLSTLSITCYSFSSGPGNNVDHINSSRFQESQRSKIEQLRSSIPGIRHESKEVCRFAVGSLAKKIINARALGVTGVGQPLDIQKSCGGPSYVEESVIVLEKYQLFLNTNYCGEKSATRIDQIYKIKEKSHLTTANALGEDTEVIKAIRIEFCR
jgi:hypothetical protein